MSRFRPRYHASIAAGSDGQMVLAIAHRGADGRPQLDHVKVLTVTGGEAGIASVYRGLQVRGIIVVPCRAASRACSSDRWTTDARDRAVLSAFASVAEEPV